MVDTGFGVVHFAWGFGKNTQDGGRTMIEKFNYFLSITVVSWLLALMVISAELFSPFKDFLKATFSHHWIGKIVISIVVFLLLGFLLKFKVSEKTAYYSSIGSLLLIFAFFVFEFLTG